VKATRAHQSQSNEKQKPARDGLSDPRTRAGGLCQSAIFLTLAGRGSPLDRAANTNAQRVRYLRGRSQTLGEDTMSEVRVLYAGPAPQPGVVQSLCSLALTACG
jgi:hypothetical protein